MKRLVSLLLVILLAVPLFAATAPVDFSGTWLLNEEESDLPRPPEGGPRGSGGFGGPGGGMRGPRGGGGGGFGPRGGLPGGGMGGPGPAMAPQRGERPQGPPPGPARELILRQNGSVVTIEREDGWSRTFDPAKPSKQEARGERPARTTTSRWDGSKFIVTTTFDGDGPSMSETYTLSDDGKRLTIASSNSRGGEKARTFKRVYDREK